LAPFLLLVKKNMQSLIALREFSNRIEKLEEFEVGTLVKDLESYKNSKYGKKSRKSHIPTIVIKALLKKEKLKANFHSLKKYSGSEDKIEDLFPNEDPPCRVIQIEDELIIFKATDENMPDIIIKRSSFESSLSRLRKRN
jgi:hypothetical protein